MATAGSGHTGIYNSRSGLPTFGNFGNTLLERSNPGLRRSTPDSEVLASSDEEVEHSRLRSIAQSKTNQIRKSSFLADQSHDTRRLSFATGSAHSPGPGSQPNTPGTSNENWGTISPSVGAWSTASAYPFGTNIWGASSRDPPARLQEVRNDNENRPPYPASSQSNAAVQRSMSFSVGQTEYSSPAMDSFSGSAAPGLTRRTSRPSNLGQEYSSLSRVSESEGGDFFSSSQATQTKSGSRALSNASAQTTPSSVLHNTPSLLRSTSSTSAFRNQRFTSSLLEESELAIDDTEDTMSQPRYPIRNAPSRRLSDFQAMPTRQPHLPSYTSAGFASTRHTPQWSSNLDFGQLDTIPQSRRHSFVDIPTRRGSMDTHEEDNHSYEDGSQGGVQLGHESTYFNSNETARRTTEQDVQRQIQLEHAQAIFGAPGPYGIPTNTASGIGSFHGPNTAPLYIVNFKCCRSDIFYIQEGTGLTVKEGDLVIVEADRGTDLGCVQHVNISLDVARKYKHKYAEQHFGWLMMFSQQTRAGAGNLFNPNAVGPGGKGNVAGASQQGTAIRDADLKPKMIKRLAQNHEIQALQEKEGNEAKAKRVCQQKVIEHGLNMEILDAEFQMDGKKLTFYFFSTEYINFNSLVTDLFKMYKTRIWMSAINPASFQSPVSSLGLTPIYGNTGLGLTAPGGGNGVPPPTNIYDEPPRDDLPLPRTYGMPTPGPGPGFPMNMNVNMNMGMPAHMMPMSLQARPSMTMPPPLYYGGYGQQPAMPDYGGVGVGPTSFYQTPADPFASYGGPNNNNRHRGGVAGNNDAGMMSNRPASNRNNSSSNPGALSGAFNNLSLRG